MEDGGVVMNGGDDVERGGGDVEMWASGLKADESETGNGGDCDNGG